MPPEYKLPDPLEIFTALAHIDPLPPFNGRKPLASDIRNLSVLTTNERRIQRWAEEVLIPTIQGLEEHAAAVNKLHVDTFHPRGGVTTDLGACRENAATLHNLSLLHGELIQLHAEKYDEMWNSILARHPQLDPYSIEIIGDGQLVEVIPLIPDMGQEDQFYIALMMLERMLRERWTDFD